MSLNDFRYGFRQLYKNPGFALVAIITLALGIGLTGSMFTVIYTVLFRPLPFPNAEQIVVIGQANMLDNHPGPASLPSIRDWREQSKSFQEIAYWNLSFRNVVSEGKAELVADIRCSANLFSLLQSKPIIGRTFYPDEDQPGKGNVAVLGATVWRRLFLSDPEIIGRTIALGADYYTVIGVMPDEFIFPLTQDRAIVWAPVQPRRDWEDRNTAMLQAVGRLKDGIPVEAAQTELTTIASRGTSGYDAVGVQVEDYRESITGNVRTALWSLKAAVLVVWLIACINIVSLLLARGSNRRREIAIRCALGAGRGRVVSQFFAESAVLGGLAGLLGLLLCFVFLQVMRFYLESKLPFAGEMHVGLPVVAAILVLSLVSTLFVGVWPALQACRTLPQEALREGSPAVGKSRRQRRVQDVLVVCEVALSLTLLLNGGLLLQTLYNLRTTPLGFEPDHLIIAQFPLPQGAGAGRDVLSTVYDPMLQTLAQTPGVESAGISTILPMSPNSTSKMPVQIQGKPKPQKPAPTAELRIVSPDLYRALGVRLLAGRFFNDSDSRSAPWAVIVNQAFARKFFPDEDPIGQQVRTNDSGPNKFSTIVGVVEDARQKSLTDAVEPEINLCYKQIQADDPYASLLGLFAQLAVRTKADPASVIPSLRLTLQQINPEVPANISTMESVVDNALGSQTLAARLIGIFAGSALLIAIIGMYGLLSYNVTRATRDIAVRLALGATRSKVIIMVIRHAALVLGIGVLLGFALWYQAARLLQSYLYGVGTHDILTILSVVVVIVASGLLASYVPARRASLVDPMTSLRHE